MKKSFPFLKNLKEKIVYNVLIISELYLLLFIQLQTLFFSQLVLSHKYLAF